MLQLTPLNLIINTIPSLLSSQQFNLHFIALPCQSIHRNDLRNQRIGKVESRLRQEKQNKVYNRKKERKKNPPHFQDAQSPLKRAPFCAPHRTEGGCSKGG